MSYVLTSGHIFLDDKLVQVVCTESRLLSPSQSWSEARSEANHILSSPLLSAQNRISTFEGWTVHAASGVIVAAGKVEIPPCGAWGEESWWDATLK